MAELQASKRALVSALMDDTQNLSGRLTRKDLEALLDLGSKR
ncbi:MAG TPA: hypothetical protein VM686_19605 [Polyangiaceae bacterium]|nr:hypothetical protein [Polyangiaceae bacterium]